VVSFSLHRIWTFGDRSAVSRSFPRWLALAAVAYPANLAIVIAAHRIGGIDAYLAQPLGIAVYTAIMFLGGRYLVFRQPSSHTSRPP
jgi:putative flippase GtrA